MGNALSQDAGAPPAPNPQPGGVPQGGPAPGPQQAPQPPAPSHQQTVAALRHFDVIKKELLGLLKNPDIGKSDIKSDIIDGATKLVGMGIFSPANAVQQLASVPDRPFDQKQWVEQHLVQAIQASNAVLDQHRQAFAGQPAPPPGAPQYHPDNHQPIIAGLMKHYRDRGHG